MRKKEAYFNIKTTTQYTYCCLVIFDLVHLYDRFLLGWQALLHVFFDSSQQIRLQDIVQLRHLGRFFQITEILQKLLHIIEPIWICEVQQRPQFLNEHEQHKLKKELPSYYEYLNTSVLFCSGVPVSKTQYSLGS